MCQRELDKRPVLISVWSPEAEGLGSSGIRSRNLSKCLLNVLTGTLLMELIQRGRQFHRLLAVVLKQFALMVCTGL